MDNNSSYTKKEGQGSLFKNDKKTAPNQPDYTGSIMVGGVEKRIAAWTRTARNGSTYLSISLSDFQGGQQSQGQGGGYNAGNRGSYNGGGYGSVNGNSGGYPGSGNGYSGGGYPGSAPQAPAPAPAPSFDDMPADLGGDAPFEDLPF